MLPALTRIQRHEADAGAVFPPLKTGGLPLCTESG